MLHRAPVCLRRGKGASQAERRVRPAKRKEKIVLPPVQKKIVRAEWLVELAN
jgi:hypothetical protein